MVKIFVVIFINENIKKFFMTDFRTISCVLLTNTESRIHFWLKDRIVSLVLFWGLYSCYVDGGPDGLRSILSPLLSGV